MYASFLDLPFEGRHSSALHLELFAVPSLLKFLSEVIRFEKTCKKRVRG
jgi:hypothetical protein